MGSQEIPLSKPDLSPLETSLVMEVMQNERLAIGPMTEEFEERVAAYVGTRHAVAVNSGTSGLFCVLKAAGVGPGDEVITTPFSFVASTNVILHAGAKPVFVDIEPVSLNMDPGLIERAIWAALTASWGLPAARPFSPSRRWARAASCSQSCA